MSAPVTERTRAASRARSATIPAQRSAITAVPQRRDGERSAAGTAAQRAYARRDDRQRKLVGGRPGRAAAPAGRAQFVLLVMVLLAVGLVATLWLSTAAAADSYRLQDARAEARALSQQSEKLHREVAAMASAPQLSRRAAALGMVPVQDPARLLVGPDGAVTVVGEPRAATTRPAPAPVRTAPVPAQADPAQPGEPRAPTDAAATDSAPTDAAPTDAAATDSAAAPAAGEPVAADPAGTGPAGTDPAVAEPAAAEPGSGAGADPAGAVAGTAAGGAG